MGEVFVVNASPLITLAKAGHLALLTALAETILVPAAVVGEVLAGPASDPARRALEGGWGTRVPVRRMPSIVVEWGLGAGEAEVIAVVLEGRGRTAVLDDAQGRKCARALRLPLIGTLGWCCGPNAWGGSRLPPRCCESYRQPACIWISRRSPSR